MDAIDYNGQWVTVDDDVAHVVQEIERHWPELRVQYCENPEIGDAPYRIVEHTPDGLDIPVTSVWTLDNRLLEMLHQADTTKHDVLAMLDKNNDMARRRRNDELLYWKDYFADVVKTAGNHMGTSFTFKDPRPDHEGEIVKVEDDPAHRTRIR